MYRITLPDVRSSLIFSKVDWCLVKQLQVVPLFNKRHNLLVMCARSGINEPNDFANPRNALTSLMQAGVGNCLIAENFLLSGLIPVSEMMCLANSVLSEPLGKR